MYGNNNAKTAAIDIAQLAIGTGILVAGGNDNVVDRNLVYDHDLVGIGVIPLPEKVINPDDPKAINFDARRNRVVGNDVSDSRAADLALVTSIDDPKDAGGNCFSDNRFSTSLPANLEQLVPCGGPVSPTFETDLARFAQLLTADEAGQRRLQEGRAPDAAGAARHARRGERTAPTRRKRRTDGRRHQRDRNPHEDERVSVGHGTTCSGGSARLVARRPPACGGRVRGRRSWLGTARGGGGHMPGVDQANLV